MKISYEDIAKRAFEIWEQEGKPEGCERKHWLLAEEELRNPAERGKKQRVHSAQKTS